MNNHRILTLPILVIWMVFIHRDALHSEAYLWLKNYNIFNYNEHSLKMFQKFVVIHFISMIVHT